MKFVSNKNVQQIKTNSLNFLNTAAELILFITLKQEQNEKKS